MPVVTCVFQALLHLYFPFGLLLFRAADSWGQWELKRELSTAVELALYIDRGVVRFDDLFCQGQAEARASFFGRVKGIEHAEGGRIAHSAAGINES